MHDMIQTHLTALQAAIVPTALTEQRKLFVDTAIGKLTELYQRFRETNASRYGDEIARVVQSILRELEACPEARKLDAEFRAGLHQLHEDLGIPKLALKAAPPPPKPARKSKV
ncbi:MAG: hypothetical protein WCL32_17220 [Planctomycetota bacterium]|jgi:hypothetical protein